MKMRRITRVIVCMMSVAVCIMCTACGSAQKESEVLNGSLNDYDLDIVTDDEDVKINGESQGDVIKIDHGRQKRIQLETEYGDVKIVIQ